jgi:UDP-N-acetylmuramate dehydrogenase
MNRIYNLNTAMLRGQLRDNETLSSYTTWRVGGPARRLFKPADVDDLETFLLGLAEDEPLLWLGLGSNLLIRDGGFNGTVIATSGVIGALEMDGEHHIRAGAGVPCNKLARYSVKHGLAGGEFLAGIPGTLGGALAMNAGAWGGETWTLVDTVETIDRHGLRRVRHGEDFQVGYRSVQRPADEWFIGARLRFDVATDTIEQGLTRIRELLAERAHSQPTGLASAGSVFRNPISGHAAQLIDSIGLKGRCHGNACVSSQHANFITHSGDACAADIEALINEVQAAVERECGVHLVPEVCIIGEAA